MDYTKIYQVTTAIADTALVLEGFTTCRQQESDMSILADTYQTKVTPSDAEKYTPPVSKPTPAVNLDGMEKITKALESLTLTTQVMANRMTATPMMGNSSGPGPSTFTGPASGTSYQSDPNRPADCYYCGSQQHRRYQCPDFNADCASGKVHMNDQQRLCLGRAGDGGVTIPLRWGQPQKVTVQNVMRATAQDQPSRTAAASVHASSLRLGADLDEEATEDTDEEQEVIEVEVLAARQDRQRGEDGSTQWRPLDRAAAQLRGKTAVENRLPTVKTLRPGDYANTGLFGQAAEGLGRKGHVEDVEMVDTGNRDAGGSRNTAGSSKDKKWKLANMLREEEDPIKILDKILNAPVSDLKVRELIGCSPSLQKLFFRSLEESDTVLEKKSQDAKAPVAGPKSKDASNPPIVIRANNVAAQDFDGYRQGAKISLVTIGCPMVRATIFDTRVKALIDSGAEVCLMSRRVAEIAGLSIRTGQNLSMVAATGHKARFVGVCMDVPIEIGGIITTVHVLVVEHSDFDLILGRPFERKSRMRTTNNDDGSLTTEIFSADGKMTSTFQSAMALHPQNRTINEIFTLKE